MFDEHSPLVKTWVRLVRENIYSKNDVLNLSNLREIVWKILDKAENEEM